MLPPACATTRAPHHPCPRRPPVYPPPCFDPFTGNARTEESPQIHWIFLRPKRNSLPAGLLTPEIFRQLPGRDAGGKRIKTRTLRCRVVTQEAGAPPTTGSQREPGKAIGEPSRDDWRGLPGRGFPLGIRPAWRPAGVPESGAAGAGGVPLTRED